MPHVTIPIDDVFATITRMVAKSVTDDLVQLTGVDVKGIRYGELGDLGKNQTAKNSLTGTHLELSNSDHLFVDYEEEPHEEHMDIRITEEEFPPIFVDRKRGIRITPGYIKAKLKFQYRYRNQSYTELKQWLMRIKRNMANRKLTNYHDILYNYTLPDSIIAYLYDVHSMSQAKVPDGRTLSEYLYAHFSEGLLTRSNLNETRIAPAINVLNKSCLGKFTTEPRIPESKREEHINEVTWEYELEFELVNSLQLEFQKVVHNQVIGKDFINYFYPPRVPAKEELGADVVGTFSSSIQQFSKEKDIGYRSPLDSFFDNQDRWLPPKPFYQSSSITIVMAPIIVDETDYRKVLNVEDFSLDWVPQPVRDIMKIYHDKLQFNNTAPYRLELWEVSDSVVMMPIEVDDQLNVTTTIDMKLDCRYYLRISALFQLDKLSPEILESLRNSPDDFLYILQSLDPDVVEEDLNLGPNNVVNQNTVEDLLQRTKLSSRYYRETFSPQRFYLVMNSNVVTRRL